MQERKLEIKSPRQPQAGDAKGEPMIYKVCETRIKKKMYFFRANIFSYLSSIVYNPPPQRLVRSFSANGLSVNL